MIEAAVQLFEDRVEKNGGLLERALAETIQYIALLGLSRSDFFYKSAFYGGTALRILYNLDRFSEDLDFSLLNPDRNFSLDSYISFVQNELDSYGFHTEVSVREKNIQTPIESAFIKAGTKLHIVEARVPPSLTRRIAGNDVCKVKFEVDTDPPAGIESDIFYIDSPISFPVRVCDGPTLFAGKLSALLTRGWHQRVKGRDWFDMVFMISRNIPVSLSHLESRLRQTGFYTKETHLSEAALRELLEKRIQDVDIELAKKDVIRFIRNPKDVDVWSKDYFRYVASKLRVQ